MMKIILMLISCIVLTGPAGQQDKNAVSHYLFPEFTNGRVLLKVGKAKTMQLNYNTVTEEMVFVNNGQNLAIANIDDMDTVFIQDRKFVPVGKVFYEVVVNSKIPLLVQHTSTLIPPGKPAGYGATTQTSSVDVLSSLAGSGKVYELTLPEYTVLPSKMFFLKSEGKYERISNVRHVTSFFPEKEAAIKDFVKKNKTNFQVVKDVSDLIIFCNQ